MFFQTVVIFTSVRTALAVFGKMVITHSLGIGFENHFLIWKLDSFNFKICKDCVLVSSIK